MRLKRGVVMKHWPSQCHDEHGQCIRIDFLCTTEIIYMLQVGEKKQKENGV